MVALSSTAEIKYWLAMTSMNHYRVHILIRQNEAPQSKVFVPYNGYLLQAQGSLSLPPSFRSPRCYRLPNSNFIHMDILCVDLRTVSYALAGVPVGAATGVAAVVAALVAPVGLLLLLLLDLSTKNPTSKNRRPDVIF